MSILGLLGELRPVISDLLLLETKKHKEILENPSLVTVAMLQWFQGTPTSGGLEAQLLGYDA